MGPDVSVLMPTFNDELTLHRAIRSALNQEGVTVEVCVVNDGSTDGTEDLLRQMPSDVRWISQPNSGIAAALNVAGAMATGAYMQCLASDDWFEQGQMAGLKAALEATPGAMVANGAYRYWGKRSDVVIPPPFERDDCYRHNPVANPMFRRAIWDEGIRWRDYGGGVEDWDWILQVVERGWQCIAVPDILTYHYVYTDRGLHAQTTKSAAAWTAFKAQWPMVTAEGF